MEHLSVQKRIKKIAEHFTGCNYQFANWTQLNTVLDKVEKPTICYILPPSGTLSVAYRGHSFTDKPLSEIAFLVPSDFDFDGEENDDLIENMKFLACQFILDLNNSGYFEVIEEDVTYKVAYDTADDNVTGIVVNLPLVEAKRSLCNIPDTFGYVNDDDTN